MTTPTRSLATPPSPPRVPRRPPYFLFPYFLFPPGCRPAMAARGLPKAQYLQRYLSGPPAAQPRRRRRKKPPGAARTG